MASRLFAFGRGSNHVGEEVTGNVPKDATVVTVTPYEGSPVEGTPMKRGVTPRYKASGGNKTQQREALRQAGEPYHR